MVNTQSLKEKREELEKKKRVLEHKLEDVESEITLINNMQKPYVANVLAYSGHYSMQFEKEEKAKKKLYEYASKRYFKNGLNHGVYLYKWNEDGSKTLLESIPIGRENFKPNL
ncbi:hypothetical protein [Bacillus atrophaeus]|uniref:hypothetical protein n=1 Tax=Bacillus atrophaeus TaxID=1452 RepID=UPI00227ED6DC|nr:hypothetical protein [Bacillus atrophaeus]MCY8958260.1 hypothetical protein [Bacillus atrophaeus]MCY8963833.1 hypothetical protein [Bacillus atrophaeus]MCY9161110.1 hypothetical protein [Bacillus atrophaeus]MCY9440147.1 hypothetical protein [Bacillus atrophaeus]MEC0648427.1 hypothetical protein [Bacillus atrophaeus]